MTLYVFKRNSFNRLVAVVQFLLLLSYFSLNIINVGEMGAALPLLAGFIVLVGYSLFLQLLRGYLVIRLHFFVFLLFVSWLSFRVVVDLQDLEELKKVTVATTGGVLLFFLLGTFLREVLGEIISADDSGLVKWLLFISVLAFVSVVLNFQGRMLERSDIFYIEGVEGGYQRPGNFMIMLFLMVSSLYLSIAANFKTIKTMRLLFWLLVYSAGMLLSLISAQMIGSNAATLNILSIYLITVVLSLFVFNKKVRRIFLNDVLVLPLSKSSIGGVIKYSVLVAFFVVFAFAAIVQVTGFELNKTRAFGFGSGENSSISSRVAILEESGIDQIGYSPIFGNVDVARIVTGDAGESLHSLIPNIVAELGLVGLIIVVLLFFMIMRSLFRLMNQGSKTEHGFVQAVLSFWLFFVFVFLFLYANIAVGKEWSVLWFFLGFTVSVFTSKTNRKNSSRLEGTYNV